MYDVSHAPALLRPALYPQTPADDERARQDAELLALCTQSGSAKALSYLVEDQPPIAADIIELGVCHLRGLIDRMLLRERKEGYCVPLNARLPTCDT